MSGHIIWAPGSLADLEVATTMVMRAMARTADAAECKAMCDAVRTLIELQAETAHEKRGKAKSRHVQWLRFQAQQRERRDLLRQAEASVESSEQRLAAVCLGSATDSGRPRVSREQGDLKLSETAPTAGKGTAILDELTEILERLPAAFRESPDSPYPKLVKQGERLAARAEAGESMGREDLTEFRDLIALNLDGFTKRLDARQRRQRETARRVEATLDDLLLYQELARPGQAAELDDLGRQLAALLQADALRLGPLEIIERRLETLRKEVDRSVGQAAYRTGLCESITRNLVDMGYGVLRAFPEDVGEGIAEAVLRIPGGEQLRVALQPTNQIAFHVIHERSGMVREEADLAYLSSVELAHLRKQEQRWCSDFRPLLRRVVAEGFHYEVSLEQDIPEQAIKVVVVETPEEVLARQAEEEEVRRFEDDKKRHMG